MWLKTRYCSQHVSISAIKLTLINANMQFQYRSIRPQIRSLTLIHSKTIWTKVKLGRINYNTFSGFVCCCTVVYKVKSLLFKKMLRRHDISVPLQVSLTKTWAVYWNSLKTVQTKSCSNNSVNLGFSTVWANQLWQRPISETGNPARLFLWSLLMAIIIISIWC